MEEEEELDLDFLLDLEEVRDVIFFERRVNSTAEASIPRLLP